jgi:drug/metabolite transporter (DMT)-like permease
MLNSKVGQFVTLLLLGVVWGSSFILMKKGLISFDSWQVASMRLVFAGFIAVPFLIIHFKKIAKKDWKFIALAGFLGNGIPAFMFTYVQQSGLESSLVGGLNALTPIFTLIVGLIFFNVKTTSKQVIGLISGLIGALFIIFHKSNIAVSDFELFPFLLVFVATFFYGININIIKSKLGHIKPVLAGMLPLSIITFPALIMLLASGTHIKLMSLQNSDYLPLLAVVALGVLGTAISLFVFNALVQKTDAIFGSAVNYLLPFVAAFWGLLDGELFGKEEALSLILIIFGIYLIRRRKLKA